MEDPVDGEPFNSRTAEVANILTFIRLVKPLEFTGNFEKDYAEGCRLQSLTPFHFARIGQIVQASQVPKSLAGLSAQDKGSYLTLNKAKKGSVNDLAKKSTISESRPDLAGAKAPSRYRFAPTINIELSEEDDEVYKIEVRGWTIPPPMTDILTNAIAACSTVTHFTYESMFSNAGCYH